MKKIDDDDLVDVTGGAPAGGGSGQIQANDPAVPGGEDEDDKTVGDDHGGYKGID